MTRRILAGLPILLLLISWGGLRALGGRDAVVVLTGMLPAGMGPEALLVGLAYVAAHLGLVVLGPPLAVFALVYALQR